MNKTVTWQDQRWELRSVTRGKEKKPQSGTCATPRQRWAAIPARSPDWKGDLFTRGQPWWLQSPFLSRHSPEPVAGRWVPHKLRGKTKLGAGFGAQVAPPQAKGLCPEHGSEPLRSETWDLPLLSEQQLQWATKRSLGLLKNESKELETGTDSQICNIPRESSSSHKCIPKSYARKLTDTCTPIAQSPNQSTTNFCYPKVRFLTQSHLPRCCLQCFSACPASHDG